jgi:hypothetical protein
MLSGEATPRLIKNNYAKDKLKIEVTFTEIAK